MCAGGDQPAGETERAEGARQHLAVGDVVVEHVDALAAGQPDDLGLQVGDVVIDAVIGAEREAGRDPRIRTRGRDYVGADYVLGDLNADRAEIAARAHDQHALAGFELGDVDEQIPGGRHVAHDHRGVVKVEPVGEFDRRERRHRDHLGKPARSFDAHHSGRPVVAAAILGANLERHDAGGGGPHSFSPARDGGSDRIDDAGAIDAGYKRKDGAASGLVARETEGAGRRGPSSCFAPTRDCRSGGHPLPPSPTPGRAAWGRVITLGS